MTDNHESPGVNAEPADADVAVAPSWWKRPAVWIGGGAGVLAAIAAAVIIPIAITSNHSPFADAVETCKLKTSDYVRLGDDGKTLSLDGGTLDGIDGLGIKDQGCINRELKVPEYVVTEMLSTRALDGVQKETFGDITARWTYHPDNGLDVIFTRK